MMEAVITGLITGLFSAGSVWGVLKTEMFYLRRDVDRANSAVDKHIQDFHLKAH